jgi:hypothetical protein
VANFSLTYDSAFPRHYRQISSGVLTLIRMIEQHSFFDILGLFHRMNATDISRHRFGLTVVREVMYGLPCRRQSGRMLEKTFLNSSSALMWSSTYSTRNEHSGRKQQFFMKSPTEQTLYLESPTAAAVVQTGLLRLGGP